MTVGMLLRSQRQSALDDARRAYAEAHRLLVALVRSRAMLPENRGQATDRAIESTRRLMISLNQSIEDAEADLREIGVAPSDAPQALVVRPESQSRRGNALT